MNPYAGFLTKVVATGVFFANGVLLGAMAVDQAINQPDLILASLTGVQGALLYAGIGSVSKTLEPEIGLRKEAD